MANDSNPHFSAADMVIVAQQTKANGRAIAELRETHAQQNRRIVSNQREISDLRLKESEDVNAIKLAFRSVEDHVSALVHAHAEEKRERDDALKHWYNRPAVIAGLRLAGVALAAYVSTIATFATLAR